MSSATGECSRRFVHTNEMSRVVTGVRSSKSSDCRSMLALVFQGTLISISAKVAGWHYGVECFGLDLENAYPSFHCHTS
uniref:Uncharacterized protein n=1 Tax=Steinernema glaseri TaxID=37863 RepID=A0A1I7YV67_9BILA